MNNILSIWKYLIWNQRHYDNNQLIMILKFVLREKYKSLNIIHAVLWFILERVYHKLRFIIALQTKLRGI